MEMSAGENLSKINAKKNDGNRFGKIRLNTNQNDLSSW